MNIMNDQLQGGNLPDVAENMSSEVKKFTAWIQKQTTDIITISFLREFFRRTWLNILGIVGDSYHPADIVEALRTKRLHINELLWQKEKADSLLWVDNSKEQKAVTNDIAADDYDESLAA